MLKRKRQRLFESNASRLKDFILDNVLESELVHLFISSVLSMSHKASEPGDVFCGLFKLSICENSSVAYTLIVSPRICDLQLAWSLPLYFSLFGSDHHHLCTWKTSTSFFSSSFPTCAWLSVGFQFLFLVGLLKLLGTKLRALLLIDLVFQIRIPSSCINSFGVLELIQRVTFTVWITDLNYAK